MITRNLLGKRSCSLFESFAFNRLNDYEMYSNPTVIVGCSYKSVSTLTSTLMYFFSESRRCCWYSRCFWARKMKMIVRNPLDKISSFRFKSIAFNRLNVGRMDLATIVDCSATFASWNLFSENNRLCWCSRF